MVLKIIISTFNHVTVDSVVGDVFYVLDVGVVGDIVIGGVIVISY